MFDKKKFNNWNKRDQTTLPLQLHTWNLGQQKVNNKSRNSKTLPSIARCINIIYTLVKNLTREKTEFFSKNF